MFADIVNEFFLENTLKTLPKASKQYFTPFLKMQMHFCKIEVDKNFTLQIACEKQFGYTFL